MFLRASFFDSLLHAWLGVASGDSLRATISYLSQRPPLWSVLPESHPVVRIPRLSKLLFGVVRSWCADGLLRSIQASRWISKETDPSLPDEDVEHIPYHASPTTVDIGVRDLFLTNPLLQVVLITRKCMNKKNLHRTARKMV